MTDKQTAALKLGLEAIEACLSAGTEAEDQDASDKLCDARAAIREALAEPQEKYTYGTPLLDAMMGKTEQPNIAKYLEKDNSEQSAQQQEPFGYFKAEPFGWTDCAETDEGAIALYERPQPAQPSKPLTDEQIRIIWRDIDGSEGMIMRFARAVEAAHGIGRDI